MNVRRKDCDHCIWKSHRRENGLAICRYRNITLMEAFWNHTEIECNAFEGYRYQDTPE